MKLLTFLFMFMTTFAYSQENNILERVTVVDNNGKLWYNIDGYSVTSEVLKQSLNEKDLKKIFKKYKIADTDVKTKDAQISSNHVYITKKEAIIDGYFQTNTYYFVENPDKTTTAISFIKNGTTDKETEEKLVKAIMEGSIPAENYVPMKINSINFAGRKIDLGNKCHWTALNTVQCPYLGEMNWSIHRTLEDAKEAIKNQLDLTKARKGGKITSEEMVSVTFEGVPTQAKKVVYELTGVTSAMAGMSGGKALIIYYVAETVNNKNVSCVMSYWNNDAINPETQLPALLETVMVLNP